MTLESNNVIHEGLKYETGKAEKTTLCLPKGQFTGTRLHATSTPTETLFQSGV